MGFVFRIVAAANAADKVTVTAAIHADDEHIHVIVAKGAGVALFSKLRKSQLFD